tara:strand:+ start:10029 stop:10181 length:153 start_codon:yes stop_codon:yes gene_type:complete
MTSDRDLKVLEKFLLIRQEDIKNGLVIKTTAQTIFSKNLDIKDSSTELSK